MNIPLQGVDEPGDPWTFEMAFAEQAQLASKVSTLLAPFGVTCGAVAVDVDNKVVNLAVTYNSTETPLSVPRWRANIELTVFPANYVADRVRGYLGIDG